jgi:hypothetical protein
MNNPRAHSGPEIRFDALMQITCQYFSFELLERSAPSLNKIWSKMEDGLKLGLNFATFEQIIMSIRP